MSTPNKTVYLIRGSDPREIRSVQESFQHDHESVCQSFPDLNDLYGRTEMFRAGMFPSKPDPTTYHPYQIFMMFLKK